MSRNKGRKRKNEDEYDLQTILDDESNDVGNGNGIPAAAEKNAEKNDEAVSYEKVMKLLNFY